MGQPSEDSPPGTGAVRHDPEHDPFGEDASADPRQVGARKVGELLRQTRESQGLSIDDVAERTRLRDVHLISLESGQVERLPGNAFVAGFMRLYAKNIGLVDHPVIEQFLVDYETARQKLVVDHFPSPTQSRQRPGRGVVIGGVVGLVVLSYAYSHFFGTEQDPSLPTSPPLKVGGTIPVISSPEPERQPPPAKSVLGFGKPDPDAFAALESPNGDVAAPQDRSGVQDRSDDQGEQSMESPPPFSDESELDNEESGAEEVVLAEISPSESVVEAKREPRPVVTPARSEGPGSGGLEKIPPVPRPVLRPRENPPPPVVETVEPLPVEATPSPAVETVTPPVVETVERFQPPVAPAVTRSVDRRADEAGLTPRQRIVRRYPEPITGEQDLVPDAPQAVSLISRELVWIQIQDEEGEVLKDMVMQPDHLFRVPVGMPFYAILGNAGGVILRIGGEKLPYMGNPGDVIENLSLMPDDLRKRVSQR